MQIILKYVQYNLALYKIKVLIVTDRQTVREVTGWKHDTLPAMAIWNDVKGSH